MSERIDLAHAPEFRLGRVAVRPALRQLIRDDGAEEVIEPRVMQVLVALAGAEGAILSRDDLTRLCWEGRVIGEDAINRVISRLRRSAEGIGERAFRIETVTKVGYRLVLDEAAPAATSTPAPADPVSAAADPALAQALAESRRLRLDRRAVFAGAGAAVVVAGGWLAWRHWLPDNDTPPADIAPLLEQARLASRQGDIDGASQATGLLRRVTQMRPDYPNGWGLLAMSYAGAAGGMARDAEAPMRARARESAGRAFALDADNAYARLAMAMLDGRGRAWRRDESLARDILAKDPDNEPALGWLVGVLGSVGRFREAAELCERVYKLGRTDPASAYIRTVTLWSADRLDDADRAAGEAIGLYPTHFAVWFTRFYLLMYTGRAAEALAMSRNVQQRPPGYSDENFAMIEQVAQAMLSRAPGEVKAAIATSLDWAHRGAGFAENSIQFCAGLGDVDTAFRIADAYYFARGFSTGENRFQTNQRVFTRQSDRRTRLLFMPPTAPMRSDPRFEKLVAELGLARYWRESGSIPDYRRR